MRNTESDLIRELDQAIGDLAALLIEIETMGGTPSMPVKFDPAMRRANEARKRAQDYLRRTQPEG